MSLSISVYLNGPNTVKCPWLAPPLYRGTFFLKSVIMGTHHTNTTRQIRNIQMSAPPLLPSYISLSQLLIAASECWSSISYLKRRGKIQCRNKWGPNNWSSTELLNVRAIFYFTSQAVNRSRFFSKRCRFRLIPYIKRLIWCNPMNNKQQLNHWQTTSDVPRLY